jgi:hypothetical protein
MHVLSTGFLSLHEGNISFYFSPTNWAIVEAKHCFNRVAASLFLVSRDENKITKGRISI